MKEVKRDIDGWFAQAESRVFLADGRRRIDPQRLRELAGKAAEQAKLAGSDVPALGLQALPALRYWTDRLELQAVAYARSLGWSWRSIGESLGISRQVLHRRYATLMPRPRRHRKRSS